MFALRVTARPTLRAGILLAIACSLAGPAWAEDAAATGSPTQAATDHIRGLVVPLNHARLSSRLQATIDKIGPENGEYFKEGDVLVQFDCTSFLAERERAKAEAEAAQASYSVKKELSASGNAGMLQAVLAEADLKKAHSAVEVADKQVSDCQIRAPYDGRIVSRIANAHETVGFRDPLLDIVADRALELRVFVPSKALRSIDKGSPVELTVDETGERLPARVIALGAQIDNVSQLIEIRAEFTGETGRLVPGMSGNVEFLKGVAAAAGDAP